jgi:hypothetical protein
MFNLLLISKDIDMEIPDNGTAQGASSRACFGVGRVDVTTAAANVLIENQINPFGLLRRHERGDHGALDMTEQAKNAEALKSGHPILSRYEAGRSSLYVITDADRRITRILLETEFGA